MRSDRDTDCFDVAIVGGGPAGLSAAMILARACRRVILFDDGKPRNYAAQAVHGFLGLDGIAPDELRQRGRQEALSYGVEINDCKVTSAKCLSGNHDRSSRFLITAESGTVKARALLLATGVRDYLPEIPGIDAVYGRLVHHCPYCDGWEHRGKHLVALAAGSAAAKLALSLRVWSNEVTACSNGHDLSRAEQQRLADNGIAFRTEQVVSLAKAEAGTLEIRFDSGLPLECGALFFGGDQAQRSHLPELLGCKTDEDGLIRTDDKQKTQLEGLFVAGDAARDVQFAIVAAAQGAIAATAINKMLTDQEME